VTYSGWGERLDDYATFHRLQTLTSDVDPVYPVLTAVARNVGLDIDQTAWLCLLHVAFYDLGSALLAYAITDGRPRPLPEQALRLPCGTERRGHRDPRQLAAHLDALVARADGYDGAGRWLSEIATATCEADGYRRLCYRTAFGALLDVRGFGRWAAYKTCELVATVLGPADPAWYGLTPTDMGHAHSTGPRKGLALLTPVPDGNSFSTVAILNQLSDLLVHELHARGLPATIPTAETTLCDFHSLHKGHYYVGHDIDHMAAQLDRAVIPVPDLTPGAARRSETMLRAAWEARSLTLPGAYLGEHEQPPRIGVDPGRRTHYRQTGAIVTRGSHLERT